MAPLNNSALRRVKSYSLAVAIVFSVITLLLAGFALSGCSKQFNKQPPLRSVGDTTRGVIYPPGDMVQRGFLYSLFHPKAQQLPAPVSFAGKNIKVGKGAQVTFTTVYGNGNHTEAAATQANVDKQKGSVAQQGTVGSTQDAAQQKGPGQMQKVVGNNNKLDATQEQAKETHWYDALLSPVGIGLGVVVVAIAVVGGIMLFGLRKKKQVVDATVDILT